MRKWPAFTYATVRGLPATKPTVGAGVVAHGALCLIMSTPLGAEARQISCFSAVPGVATNNSSHIGLCVFGEAIDNHI